MSRPTVCSKPGQLYVIATPIGNLKDISERTAEILISCDFIAAESFLTTIRLLNHLGIKKKILLYHEHNEISQANNIAGLVESGNIISLVSDSGTPTISDPGFRLVRECRRRKSLVIPLPGPSAHVTALSASGLPSDGFLFLGFLPPKSSARIKYFRQFAEFEYTLVFYESCNRITKFLNDLIDVLGPDRTICVAREMTKIHETYYIGLANDVHKEIHKNKLRGEFVVIIAKKGFRL